MTALATRAEIVKLAALLGVAPDRLAGLAPAGEEDLRALREQVTDVLYEGDADALRTVAAGARIVPPQVSATVAQRTFGPSLLGRLTAVVDVDRAVAVAERLPSELLADVAVTMDPRRAPDIIVRIPERQVVEVAVILTARGEHVAMGRFVGLLDDRTLRACVEVIDDAALLRCGFVLEERDRLDAVVGLLPRERVHGIVAAADRESLWPEALHLVAHVGDERRAALAGAPVLREERTVVAIVEAAHVHGLWDDLLPLVAYLPADVRTALAGRARATGGPDLG